MSKSSGVILPIQYLRGIAAMMVVWHHSREQLPALKALFPSEFGTWGVDLFFVISGFIMVVTTSKSSVTAGQFWLRRIIRVVPLYWLLTLAMVGSALVAPQVFKTLIVAPDTLVKSLLFIPHFSRSFPDMVWPLLVPGWTLNFEMFFYAVFGALLFLPAGRLVTLVCVFVALVLVGHFFGPFDSAAARTYTDSHLLEFAGGSLIGSAWVKGLFQFPDIGRSRVLLAIGDASYSIYLTHLFTLGVLRVVWAKAFPESQLMFLVVGMPVCAIVGWMSYRWLETPLLHWLGGRSRPRLKPAPST